MSIPKVQTESAHVYNYVIGRMNHIFDVSMLVSLEAGVEVSVLYHSDKGREVHIVAIAVKLLANRRLSAR